MWLFSSSPSRSKAASSELPSVVHEEGPSSNHGLEGSSPPTRLSTVTKLLQAITTAPVNFKDVTLQVPSQAAPQAGSKTPEEEPLTRYASRDSIPDCSRLTTTRPRIGVQKNKLVIIMVGLPGRGKTFLCNKLKRYLNWLGHATKHFNVGNYRRKQRGTIEQDASFFDQKNEEGSRARHEALMCALDDLIRWLSSDEGQVAILDGTNSTNERRNFLRQHFHGRWQYLFVESICSDQEVLDINYRAKMRYSPDYTDMDEEQAVLDFRKRISNYEEVYEPITDRTIHYIKLVDMITGRAHLDINRISGYIPGKMVFYLMQVCKAGNTPRKLWLTRHGQSLFNTGGRLGGDSSISASGERYAGLLPAALLSRLPASQDGGISLSVWTSTLKRTIETAQKLPFPKLQWKALDEINAGMCDGYTYDEIAQKLPEEFKARKKDKLRYRYPSGESYMDVIQRLEPVITEMERERESVLVVAHQAVLRALYGYFLGIPLAEVPSLEIPLHTLIELTPMPDGTFSEARIAVDVDGHEGQFLQQQTHMVEPLRPYAVGQTA